MMENHLDAMRRKAEDLEWSWYDCNDGYVELQKSSPAGEDFWITVNTGNLVDEVRSASDCFDPDEHVRSLLNAKAGGFRGVPDVKTLAEDADAIQEMLEELAGAMEAIEKEVGE